MAGKGIPSEFDETWISNRLRYRKTHTNNKLVKDKLTGFLESYSRHGFNGEKKKVFIDRFRICKSMAGVAKSIPIDIQAVYDAIAVDPLFREEFKKCLLIDGRFNKLNNALIESKIVESQSLISELLKKAEKYNTPIK